MIKTLIDSEMILGLAYGDSEYKPISSITEADIAACEQRFLRPVIGDKMMLSLAAGEYAELFLDYVAPALAYYVRYTLEDENKQLHLQRAREMMLRLSTHLEDNASSYAEYSSAENVLNKCRINGGFAQVL